MAKKKASTKKSGEKVYVVEYINDSLVGVLKDHDLNHDDEGISIVSEHSDIESAVNAGQSYAKKSKLNFKY